MTVCVHVSMNVVLMFCVHNAYVSVCGLVCVLSVILGTCGSLALGVCMFGSLAFNFSIHCYTF